MVDAINLRAIVKSSVGGIVMISEMGFHSSPSSGALCKKFMAKQYVV